MSRSHLFALLLTVITLAFAGCGGDESDGVTPPDGASSGAPDGSTTDGSSSGGEDGGGDGGPRGTVPASAMEPLLSVTALGHTLATQIGKSIWVHGYYGGPAMGSDGRAYLVDKPIRLATDEMYPEHSFARLDGTLPPADMDLSEVMVFGEVKDFATATSSVELHPVPLVTVTKFVQISPKPADALTSWAERLLLPDPSTAQASLDDVPGAPFFDPFGKARAVDPGRGGRSPSSLPRMDRPRDDVTKLGMQAEACDRSVIISGGVSTSGNNPRYKDNVIAKFKKMKALGFTDQQIKVFYDDATPIDVDGTNIVDEATDKQKIIDYFNELLLDMTGSCTLTIFITDHGTGYDATQGYEGARPALTGDEATGGKQYAENTFKVDGRRHVFRESQWVTAGTAFLFQKDSTGKATLYKRSGDRWVATPSDANGDGFISEAEIGVDLDGDGTNEADFGWNVADLEASLGEVKHADQEWDTDGDGTKDVRLHWDGTKYVFERLVSGTWSAMGADTNGDNIIDAADGGVDWNLDGDKGDTVGFHEGINLWGRSVLWDDELASLLAPLHDKGVHIMMEMVSCFSGGFVDNLKGKVENVVAGSAEDTKHYNYMVGGKWTAVDEMEFLNNLAGIDTASWSAAWDKAVEADQNAATAAGVTANSSTRYETPKFASNSKFEAIGDDGTYNIELDIPAALAGQVYDFEFIFGLQQPRWLWGGFPEGLPPGMSDELVGGGIRVFSASPIPTGTKLKVKGSPGSTQIRINLTDVNHKTLGYTMAQPGTVTVPAQIHVEALTGNFRHFPSQGYSEVYGTVTILDSNGAPVQNATVTLTNNNGAPITVTTNAAGTADYVFQIFQYGTYTVRVTNVTHATRVYNAAMNVTSEVVVVVN
jgi:hypothetical protein